MTERLWNATESWMKLKTASSKKNKVSTRREASLEKQIKENDAIKENLNRQIEVVNIKRTELEKHQEEHIRRLEKIAGLICRRSKSQLVESLKQEAHTKALVHATGDH